MIEAGIEMLAAIAQRRAARRAIDPQSAGTEAQSAATGLGVMAMPDAMAAMITAMKIAMPEVVSPVLVPEAVMLDLAVPELAAPEQLTPKIVMPEALADSAAMTNHRALRHARNIQPVALHLRQIGLLLQLINL